MATKSAILFALLSLSCLATSSLPDASAQEIIHFASTWGGIASDYGQSVAVDTLGNVYVTGYTYSFGAGQSDIFLVKYNASGSLTWQKTWGGGGQDFGQGVGVGPAGHVYVAGYAEGFGAGNQDVILLEYDADGTLVRQQSWGGTLADRAFDMAVASDGSVYIVGYTNSFGSGTTFDALVLKFDSTGGLAWQRTWGGGTKNDFGFGAGLDTSGNIYVGGETNSTGAGPYEAFLLKFDASGTLLWQRSWGGTGVDFLEDVSVDSSGAVYFAGGTDGFGAGSLDGALLRLDSNGSLVWEKTWGSSEGEFLYGIATDKSGNIYGSGPAGTSSEAFLLKFASNGALSYQRKWGGGSNDYGARITMDLSGNPVMVGTVQEAAPYTVSTPALSLGTPGFSLGAPSFGTATPSGVLGPVSGTVSSPAGSTSYGGSIDSFVLSYGLPNIGLTVTSGLTTLQPGQATTITVRATSQGSALGGVTVNLSSPAGTFNPASGTTNSTGYFVTTFTAAGVASQTTITITATAAKANYNDAIPVTVSLTATPSALFLDPTLLAIVLAATAAVAVAAFLVFRKRKRPSPATTAPSSPN